jgi:lambda repressor-like predicted transcriptional regulator
MNIYNLHNKPEDLHGHDKKHLAPPIAYDAVAQNHKLIGDPEIEAAIAKDASYSLKYVYLSNDRFVKGEAAIASNPGTAYQYASDICGPFPKGEDAIARDGFLSYKYAHNVLRGPFPKGEDAILTQGLSRCVDYAVKVAKRPFPKAEKMIANSHGLLEYYLDAFPERTSTLDKLRDRK